MNTEYTLPLHCNVCSYTRAWGLSDVRCGKLWGPSGNDLAYLDGPGSLPKVDHHIAPGLCDVAWLLCGLVPSTSGHFLLLAIVDGLGTSICCLDTGNGL